jgi:hypothetical protein
MRKGRFGRTIEIAMKAADARAAVSSATSAMARVIAMSVTRTAADPTVRDVDPPSAASVIHAMRHAKASAISNATANGPRRRPRLRLAKGILLNRAKLGRIGRRRRSIALSIANAEIGENGEAAAAVAGVAAAATSAQVRRRAPAPKLGRPAHSRTSFRRQRRVSSLAALRAAPQINSVQSTKSALRSRRRRLHRPRQR